MHYPTTKTNTHNNNDNVNTTETWWSRFPQRKHLDF